MEPKRRYTQVVKRPFHISMAALDIFSADENPTQLMLYFEERNYLLCTLQKGHTVQCPLDLNFEIGDEVVFASNGSCNIHLSGYLQEDQLDNLDGDLEEGEEEEEVEENEQAVKVSRKKKSNFPDSGKPSSKKSKLEELLKEEYDSNDEDDESFVVSGAAEDEDDIEEEEDDDDDEEYEDEEEEDESDDEEEQENTTTKSNLQVKNEKKSNVQAINGEKPKSLKNQIKDKKKNDKSKKDAAPIKQNEQKNASPQQKEQSKGGAIAKSGKVVQVYYEGRLKQNNKLFDQSTKGSGFKFRLGKQEVIKGWDVGVVGMKVGGRRRITCPPTMAYGQKGSPPAIPPNAALVFEVELKNVI
ncbi:hypothetical protein RI129_001614 [Pyrocoelia pectoralis]|uniref:peptidylprolyl isomerase n=1 Tax=Pyrocoelia pectoralis TaxID=417401 RepID=A0AAN7ZK43_9COLE